MVPRKTHCGNRSRAAEELAKPAAAIEADAGVMSSAAPKALVLLRVPRGSPSPADESIRAAIQADRRRLGLAPANGEQYRVAGPYRIEIGGEALDEYVAWEV